MHKLFKQIKVKVTPLHKVTLNHAGKEHILQVAEDGTILRPMMQCPSRIVSGKVGK